VLTRVIRKIHIYAGLLTFSQLLVYGIAGIVATLQPALERPKQPHSTRYVPFTAPVSATDREVALQVFRQMNFPLTRPVPDWFLRRTPDNHLLLDFYNINGIYRVVVLEEENRLRVEQIRNSNWLFVEDIHAATIGDAEAPPLIRAWAVWNEAGLWALLGFCASGVWLWLATRPRFPWAWVALTAGVLSFGAMWRIFR
jgi:uncharacterized iron-regulated membrane protein